MPSTVWDLFQRGGPLMWPLLAASIAATTIILERMVAFARWRQSFFPFLERLRPLVLRRAWTEAEELCDARGAYANLAGYFLRLRTVSVARRTDTMQRQGAIIVNDLERRLRWLAMLAQVSTLLGLLATFHVMIIRFSRGTASGVMQPADFTAAIWEALLTTMYGLMIAIPCSAAFQIFEGKLDAVTRQMGILVSYMEEWLAAAESGDGDGTEETDRGLR